MAAAHPRDTERGDDIGRGVKDQRVVNAPVAVSNWYPALTCGSSNLVLPSGHTRATAMTGGLNQVRVSGFVCVFAPGTSAPFPLFLPSTVLPALPSLLFHPTPLSPATSPPPPPLFSSSYSCYFLSSSPSILTLPSFPTVEMSFDEGGMQSCRRPRRIGRSLTNPNCDP
ncbi:unnamed protein product [Schistocephalus solidus]|uniref:Uncharacterized protein n=1 Tax=Schistocephalus solidus TaxID=70667 RepID=A0A183TLX0_SCHSO|nr:unnamed protein product [Schistocephalus solidus]